MQVKIDTSVLESLHALLERVERVVITTHMSADGDAIGSSMAWATVLRRIGKYVDVVLPDRLIPTLQFLQGVHGVTVNSERPDAAKALITSADVVFCLDFNSPHRVDKLQDLLLATKAEKVMIDHHERPDDFCDIVVSQPKISSTCELVYRLIHLLGMSHLIDSTVATYLYTGLVTDTGNFAFSNADAETLEAGADLIRYGADKVTVWENAVNTMSEAAMRIMSYAVSEKMRIYPEAGLAVISLDADELAARNYHKGDTEGLVNKPLCIPQIRWSVFLREDSDRGGKIKVSMRSQGSFDVSEICSTYFGGGGHKNAAGGDFCGTIAEAESLIEKIKDNYLIN